MKPNILRNLTKIVFIFTLLKQTLGKGFQSTCWACGSAKEGEIGDDSYNMCTWGGFLKNKNAVICCKPGSTSIYC